MSKELPTYPRTAYTLTSGFNVRKVTLVRPYSQTSSAYGGYTARGIFYSARNIFESPKAAIKAGRSQIKRRKKNLEAGLVLLANQSAALDKAESTTTAAQAATPADSQKGEGE